MPHIKLVMTPFPYSIEEGASLEEADAQMREHQIGHLPVMKDGRLIGILADRDVQVAGGNTPGGNRAKLRVSDAAVGELYAVDLNEPLDNVLVHMARHRTDCALVTKNGKLVGLFTATDACRNFAEYLRDQFLPSGGDDAA